MESELKEQNQSVAQKLKDRITDRLMLSNSYRKVFGNADGERVLRHLMRECGILNPSISTDTNKLLIQQGQRHVVLSILRIINMDETELIKSIEESFNED